MVEFVVCAILGFLALVILPLLAVGLVLRLVFGLIVLPFKVVGAVAGTAVGIAGGVAKLGFGLLAMLAGVLAVLGVVLLIPLIPLVLIGGLIWLVAR